MQKQILCGVMAIVVAGCGTATPTPSPAPTSSSGPGAVPSVSPTAPSTASASIAAATPSASSAAAAWHSVGTTTGLDGATSLDVVAWFKDRWVVFGQTNDGQATWSSTDGIAWHKGVMRSSGSGSAPVTIGAIASNGDVAVAVGLWREVTSGASLDVPLVDRGAGTVAAAMERGEGPRVIPAATCEGLASADAAVMTSTDGVTWSRVPDAKTLRGQPMLGVVAFHGGFVAAGGADGSGRSATWTSPDGRHWTRGPDDAALRSGWISAVTAFGDSVIAVGGSACDNLLSVPRAWRSTDGRSWSLATGLIKGTCCGAAAHVAADTRVAVADGAAGSPDASSPSSATWTSGDGSTWTVHPQADQTDTTWIVPIVATADGFLGAGEGVWSSPDGVTWTNVVSHDVNFEAIAIGPNGALAVGVPDIWVGPASTASP